MKIINQLDTTLRFKLDGPDGTVDSGDLLDNETYFNGLLTSGTTYAAKFKSPPDATSSALVFPSVTPSSTITLSATAPFPVTAVDYNTNYTLLLADQVFQYVGESSGNFDWAYLQASGFTLSLYCQTSGRVGQSGPVTSGDKLLVCWNDSGSNRNLYARGETDWSVRWISESQSDPSDASYWSIWADSAHTRGLPIVLGQPLYLSNDHYSSGQGKQYLTPRTGSDAQYLTVDATMSTFLILPAPTTTTAR